MQITGLSPQTPTPPLHTRRRAGRGPPVGHRQSRGRPGGRWKGCWQRGLQSQGRVNAARPLGRWGEAKCGVQGSGGSPLTSLTPRPPFGVGSPGCGPHMQSGLRSPLSRMGGAPWGAAIFGRGRKGQSEAVRPGCRLGTVPLAQPSLNTSRDMGPGGTRSDHRVRDPGQPTPGCCLGSRGWKAFPQSLGSFRN